MCSEFSTFSRMHFTNLQHFVFGYENEILQRFRHISLTIPELIVEIMTKREIVNISQSILRQILYPSNSTNSIEMQVTITLISFFFFFLTHSRVFTLIVICYFIYIYTLCVQVRIAPLKMTRYFNNLMWSAEVLIETKGRR